MLSTRGQADVNLHRLTMAGAVSSFAGSTACTWVVRVDIGGLVAVLYTVAALGESHNLTTRVRSLERGVRSKAFPSSRGAEATAREEL